MLIYDPYKSYWLLIIIYLCLYITTQSSSSIWLAKVYGIVWCFTWKLNFRYHVIFIEISWPDFNTVQRSDGLPNRKDLPRDDASKIQEHKNLWEPWCTNKIRCNFICAQYYRKNIVIKKKKEQRSLRDSLSFNISMSYMTLTIKENHPFFVVYC